MWNNIKKIAWIIFDRYIHTILHSLYLSVVTLEYCLGSFNLSQFITYTVAPSGLFVISYIYGYKRAERYVHDVNNFHMGMMQHLFQNLCQKIEGEKSKSSKPEIH